jgi:beta-xylosidase
MKRFLGIAGVVLFLVSGSRAAELAHSLVASNPGPGIDAATVEQWAAPFLKWHYWPGHVVPAEPRIPGYEAFKNTDAPCVFQLPGQPGKWFLSFIAFDGQGYNSFTAESEDLVHWKNFRLAMGFGPEGEFDHGGGVVGAYLYESWDLKAPRTLKRHGGKFWSLYGAYPRQGGYELRPGYEGVASSEDGLHWQRAKPAPILAVQDKDCGPWEESCIYQPWLLEHQGQFYDFYNAARGGQEQTGVAFSSDLLNWRRYPANPVIRNRPGGYDEAFASDPKVFRDGDHWTMLYFGVGRGGAHIMAAFSRDLLHWTARAEPLYKAGGHPLGLDKTYAHKIALAFDSKTEIFYLYYCAVGNHGRGIGLLTSKPVRGGK